MVYFLPFGRRKKKKVDAQRKAPLTVVVICNCTMGHAGRPDQKTGCGAFGQVVVKEDE